MRLCVVCVCICISTQRHPETTHAGKSDGGKRSDSQRQRTLLFYVISYLLDRHEDELDADSDVIYVH